MTLMPSGPIDETVRRRPAADDQGHHGAGNRSDGKRDKGQCGFGDQGADISAIRRQAPANRPEWRRLRSPKWIGA